MSAIQTTVRRVVALQVPRAVAASAPRAAFSASTQLQKTVTESAKDSLKSVDRAVSDKIVDGINIGSTLANKVKETGGEVSEGNATGKAEELRQEAKGTASQVAGKAEGKASELAGETKGAAHQAAGKAKGVAEEAQRKL